MLGWLNQNSGAINAILSALLTIATAVYVYLTRHLLLESIAVRKAASQPAIAITPKLHPLHMAILNLEIQNVGGGAAYDVAFKVHQSVKGNGITDLSTLGFVRNGMKYFAAGERIELFLASSVGNLARLKETPLTIAVTYRGSVHAPVTEAFEIDFGLFENVPKVSDVPEQAIAESLAKLEASVSAFSRGAEKLAVRVVTEEEEARRGRISMLYYKLNHLSPEDFAEIERAVDGKHKEIVSERGA